MTDNKKEIDEAYDELMRDGKVTVENIVRWMKDAQILEMLQKSEKEAQALFKDVGKEDAVSKEQFRDVVEELLEKNVEILVQMNEMMVAASAKLSEEMQEAAASSARATPRQDNKDIQCILH